MCSTVFLCTKTSTVYSATSYCCFHFSPHACRECRHSGQMRSGSCSQTPPLGSDPGHAQCERSPQGISSWLSWWIAAGASGSCRRMRVCACPPGLSTEQNNNRDTPYMNECCRFFIFVVTFCSQVMLLKKMDQLVKAARAAVWFALALRIL